MESQSPAANQSDAVAIELSAPEGWKKKFIQKGGIPRRKHVVFTSPTGEEIKSKRQLELYMKSHPGGPSTSEFFWGSGDTPRRSSRLNVNSKAVESPESETPKKKQRKSSSKKELTAKKDDPDNEDKTTKEKEGANEGSKESLEVVMEAATTDKDNVKDTKQKANEGEGLQVEEALPDVEKLKDAEQKSDQVEDAIMGEPENLEMVNKTSDNKEEGSETKSMPTPDIKVNNKEDEKGADAKDSSLLPFPIKAVSSAQGAGRVKEAVSELADTKVEDDKEAEKELEAPTKLPQAKDICS